MQINNMFSTHVDSEIQEIVLIMKLHKLSP